MAAEPIIEILDNALPDLHLVPDWEPTPDPLVQYPGQGAQAAWNDVYDWISTSYHALSEGTYIPNPVTGQQVQQMIDAAVGQVVKAFGGFTNLNSALTIQATSLLEDAINNLATDEQSDFRTHDLEIDAVNAQLNYITQYVIPDLQAQITQTKADAFAFALAAQANAQQWATEHIFDPLYDEFLKVQPAIDAGTASAVGQAKAYTDTNTQSLLSHVATTIAPLAALATAANSWIDDCGEPMCQTMGPKTDLGKLLKALSIAADAALIAELLGMNENDLVSLIQTLAAKFAGVVSDFESFFTDGTETIGDTITHALSL